MLNAFDTVLTLTFHGTSPASRSVQEVAVGVLILFVAGFCLLTIARPRKRSKPLGHTPAHLLPPIIDIPLPKYDKASEIFSSPQKAYESALKNRGPVIGVWRKGRLEYIVNEEYTKEVLSNDQDFSFERGTASALNLEFIIPLSKGKFFKDIHMMVTGGIIPRMEKIVDQIFPTFKHQAHGIVKDSQLSGNDVNLFAHLHRCIAEAMLITIVGEKYVSDRTLQVTEETAHAIATMTGIYQNLLPFARTFPKTWKVITWARLVVKVIIFQYCHVIVPIIWREICGHKYRPLNSRVSEYIDEEERHDEPLVHYVARMYTDSQGHVSILSAMWVSTLVLAISKPRRLTQKLASFIFASVHQTAAVAVWVVFELSIQKEYLASVQEELSAIADGIDSGGVHKLTYDALRRSTVLDSFIREVLRTKGDTLSAARETVRDVSLAGYTIPEGSFVSPMATLTHRSRTLYSEKAAEFDPNRWLEGPASSTIDPGYLPFGFGRWACPGHILAVTEIKMIVLTLLAISVPEVEGGEYIVVDPMNVTSVPPVGRLLLHPLNPKPNNN
ncbi:cytochrome P450 [Pisolithus orientalis]|uniref:cytochrome P450 n=1 Tax=Pisolithus orientalis TaxID=936130 RepID=UPI002224603B|nr:cytochrome P450 [Pisolithus orientalis]KAI5996563.1 cytochrome P450 [Pisolithus orientalis]